MRAQIQANRGNYSQFGRQTFSLHHAGMGSTSQIRRRGRYVTDTLLRRPQAGASVGVAMFNAAGKWICRSLPGSQITSSLAAHCSPLWGRRRPASYRRWQRIQAHNWRLPWIYRRTCVAEELPHIKPNANIGVYRADAEWAAARQVFQSHPGGDEATDGRGYAVCWFLDDACLRRKQLNTSVDWRGVSGSRDLFGRAVSFVMLSGSTRRCGARNRADSLHFSQALEARDNQKKHIGVRISQTRQHGIWSQKALLESLSEEMHGWLKHSAAQCWGRRPSSRLHRCSNTACQSTRTAQLLMAADSSHRHSLSDATTADRR